MAWSKGGPGKNKLTLPRFFHSLFFFLLNTPAAHLLLILSKTSNQWKNAMVEAKTCYYIYFTAKAYDPNGGFVTLFLLKICVVNFYVQHLSSHSSSRDLSMRKHKWEDLLVQQIRKVALGICPVCPYLRPLLKGI